MSAFTFYVFINIIVEQINWSIDKFLLGRMKGTGAVAVYSVGAQIVVLYRLLSGAIRGVFVPQINSMVAGHASLKDINVLFIKLGRVIFMAVFFIYSGFLAFGKEFIWFWAGDGYDNSFWCAIIPMTALIVPLIQEPGIDIQRAMNRHQVPSVAYVFIAVGNLLISIALIGRFGEIGASVGTAVALILGQGLFMNYYYHKKIGLNMWEFWKSILAFTPGCAILLVAGYVIKFVAYPDSILILISEIILYSAIYCVVIYFVCMNEYEKEIVKSTICKIRG
jgi:O-antigen/teichoic acid export membrane protein